MSGAWGLGGLLTAGLGLIALETILSAQNNPASGASNLPKLLELPGQLAAAWMDPARPLITDKGQKQNLASGGAAGAAAGAGLAASSPTSTTSSRTSAAKGARTVGAGAQLGGATLTMTG